MKNRIFMAIMALVMQSLVVALPTEAYAQSDEAVVNEFVSALKEEFVANDDVILVKSVTRNANVITIDACSVEGGNSAMLLYEVMDATRRYMIDNPVPLPVEYKKVQDALVGVGVSFRLSIRDADSNKRYIVKYTAKEFVGMYASDNVMDNPEMIQKLFKYIPFDKLVMIVNETAGGAASPFVCENGFLYIVLPVQTEQFVQLKEFYEHDPGTYVNMLKSSMAEGLDEDSRMFIDLAHDNNYRLGVKVVCQGRAPLLIPIE